MSDFNLLSEVGRYIERARMAHSRRRTERLIGSLPHELRKDIGWPDITQAQQGRDGAPASRC